MKQLLILFTFLLCFQHIKAQSLSFFDIDASKFPTLSAKFFAFDKDVQQQQPKQNEITVSENGLQRKIVGIDCPSAKAKSLSVCIISDSYKNIDLVRNGTKKLINFLIPGSDEIGIITTNHNVQIHQDLTSDFTKATLSAQNIPEASNADFENIFFKTHSGGVPFISNRTTDKKILILVTDLNSPDFNLDTAQLYREARDQNFTVYSILLGTKDYTGLFKRLSTATDGKVFEMIESEETLSKTLQEITIREHNGPCRITWEGGPYYQTTTVMELTWGTQTSKLSYYRPGTPLVSLVINSSPLNFNKKLPTTVADTNLTLTAINADFTITGIERNFGSSRFSVVNQTFPLVIKKNTSKDITIRFEPIDSNMSYASFKIINDMYPIYFRVNGGYLENKMNQTILKVIKPNGGEKYIAGSDSLIIWEGIAETDTVQLEYSIDNGSTWKLITNKASGLKYIWKNKPKIVSNQCKIRVKQLNGAQKPGSVQYDFCGLTSVKSVSWSPDGKKIATGGDKLVIWDAVTGVTRHIMYSKNISEVSWSPDGKKIAITDDVNAEIWDPENGQMLLTLKKHDRKVFALRWNFDGTKIATASEDKTIIIWDAQTGLPVTSLRHDADYLLAFDWSPDGSKIVSGGSNKKAYVWNAITGEKNLTLEGSVSSASWSPDGKRIATSGDITIFWDAQTGVKQNTIPESSSSFAKIQWSPDNKKLLTVSNNNDAVIWDAALGTVIHRLKGHTSSLRGMKWSSDGKKVVTVSNDSSAIVWDATNGVKISTLRGHAASVYSVSWSPDGQRIVTGSEDISAVVWDAASGSKMFTFKGHYSGVSIVKWSPDEKKIVSGAGPQAIIWDAVTGHYISTLSGHSSSIEAVHWNPDRSKLATASRDKTAIIWDALSGKKLTTLTGHTDVVGWLEWSDDGSKVITASHDNTAIIWDAKNGTKLNTLKGHTNWVVVASWSPDGTKIATVSYDKTVIIWDAATYSKLYSKTGDGDKFPSFNWSPDGSKFIITTKLKPTIFNSSNGQEILSLNYEHVDFITDWSHDGKKIAVTDGRIAIIWDAFTGEGLDTLNSQFSGITMLKWSHDGSKIATSGSITTIWSVENTSVFHFLISESGYESAKDLHWSSNDKRLVTASSGKSANSVRTWFIEDKILQEDESDEAFSIISASPVLNNTSINLGNVFIGAYKDSAVKAVICNQGSAPLHILGIDIISPNNKSDFKITGNSTDFFIGPNECEDIIFRYTPTEKGTRSTNIIVRTTLGILKDSITISGQGITPTLIPINKFIDIGTVAVGSQKDTLQAVSVKNSGTTNISIDRIEYLGSNKTDFSVIGENFPITIYSIQTKKMNLRFKPTDAGRTSGLLRLYYKGGDSSITIQVFGEGVAITGAGNQSEKQNSNSISSSVSLSTFPVPTQNNLQIRYEVQTPVSATLELINISGEVVQAFFNNRLLQVGSYSLTNNMNVFGSGVYYLRLTTNKEVLTTRVDVVK